MTIAKSEKDGTFTITAKNLQGFDGYKEVKIPFWSHANGMKDIIWYTPTRQADGSYTVTAKASDHENADGKYEAQVFYVDAQGQNKFVKKAFIDYTATKPANAVAADLTITKSEKDGTFTITAKNLQGFDGYKEVKIPFWSHAYGIQGKCAIYIEGIEGDYNNVVGLPVARIYKELQKLGIDPYLW